MLLVEYHLKGLYPEEVLKSMNMGSLFQTPVSPLSACKGDI